MSCRPSVTTLQWNGGANWAILLASEIDYNSRIPTRGRIQDNLDISRPILTRDRGVNQTSHPTKSAQIIGSALINIVGTITNLV